MINIKIEHRCTGQENLDYNYVVNSKLYIYPENEGDYFEYDDSSPISLIYRPYIQNNISPRITISGEFTPNRGEIYETNDEEEYNIIINVNYDPLPPSSEEPGDNNSSVEIPTSFSFTVKSYKSGTYDKNYDFKVDTCYYVERYDEENYIYLRYYIDYELNGDVYTYTNESTYKIPLVITNYKLSSFHGLENGESKTGEKDGINNYSFEAYYIDNDFTVNIDAKGIDRSQVVVQNPNFTNIKYELPYEYNYPNTTLLLEALTSNDDYVFDYWEVNGEKYSTNSILDYEITQDTIIYCYFKEKPSMVEGKIATNEDIYNASKYIYGANNNQCPTKEFIINNGYDIVKFNNEYQDNQCVVLDDLSFERVFDNIVIKNNCGVALDAFGIYFSYDEPAGSNTYDFLYYEFEDDYISKNFDGIIPTKKLYSSNLGDYRNKKLYLGFWSKNWENVKRKFTFKINEKTFTTKEASHDYVKSDIDVIDFLRHYYNKITIIINKN